MAGAGRHHRSHDRRAAGELAVEAHYALYRVPYDVHIQITTPIYHPKQTLAPEGPGIAKNEQLIVIMSRDVINSGCHCMYTMLLMLLQRDAHW
jgi:hypothetical protein